MKSRFKIKEVTPEAYEVMYSLEKYLQEAEIDFRLKELVKIRASQVNACAYCIEIHTKDARRAGETEQRIYALSAWRESPLFSEKERVILAMTEEITHISKEGLTDETYQKALSFFTQKDLANIIMQIVAINSWNRIAISTHLQHEPNGTV